MSDQEWNRRFLESTRGKILLLLRGTELTVKQMAEELSLTENAVRAHLATLERDNLVRQSGQRRAFRKPQKAYTLTEQGEEFFPKAHELLFNALIDILKTDLGAQDLQRVLVAVGEQLGRTYAQAVEAGDPAARRQMALRALSDLGGLAKIERAHGGVVIQGTSCPLAALVREHPEVCQVAQALLTAILGEKVQEQCTHGETPRCCFFIETRAA